MIEGLFHLRRINRNIVECKLKSISPNMRTSSRINRNIVECKYTHNLYDNLHYLELIETLWNVNDIQEYHFQYKL